IDLQVTDDRGGAVNAFVNIIVTPSGSPLNLATYATATASTENVAHNQQASKAIDGIVDGYPNNEAREGASLGQSGGGAWLQLTWPGAQSIFRVVLHDRINTSDQVTDGLLRFSDGSTVPFGALPDDGTGLRVTFASRNVTWVRFEVGHQRGSSPGLA